jgi:hypothetical protein
MNNDIIQTIADVINGKKKLPEIAFGIDNPTIIKVGIVLTVVFAIPLWGIYFLKLKQQNKK